MSDLLNATYWNFLVAGGLIFAILGAFGFAGLICLVLPSIVAARERYWDEGKVIWLTALAGCVLAAVACILLASFGFALADFARGARP